MNSQQGSNKISLLDLIDYQYSFIKICAHKICQFDMRLIFFSKTTLSSNFSTSRKDNEQLKSQLMFHHRPSTCIYWRIDTADE